MGRIEKFFCKASEQAQNSDMNSMHGSVVVKNGKVISVGNNTLTRTRISSKNYCSIHAEMSSVHNACGTLGTRGFRKRRKCAQRGLFNSIAHGCLRCKNNKDRRSICMGKFKALSTMCRIYENSWYK